MNWWGWTILAAYLVGYVLAVPRIGYVMATEMSYASKIGGEDVALGLFFGALIATAWPIVFPFHAWYRYAKRRGMSGAGLLVPPRYVRREVEMERRESEMRAREQHIQRLERELGVGQS